jgi:Periplasmic binding protein
MPVSAHCADPPSTNRSLPGIKFVKDQLGGSLEGKKIAYLFYDNPVGHEPLVILQDLQKIEKFELKTFAVPPPGVEMGAQVLDIAQRFRPDFVIARLFGRSPSVSIKELKRAGYPLAKVISLVWTSAEVTSRQRAAGQWLTATILCSSLALATNIPSAERSSRCTKRSITTAVC